MEITTWKKRTNTAFPKLKFTIDYNMRDYSDTTLFKEKFARAKASIEKHGLPDVRVLFNIAASPAQ
jgi:hypothetical protein